MTKTTQLLEGAVIRGAQKLGYDGMLTAEAIAFVADLERKFGPERRRLLAAVPRSSAGSLANSASPGDLGRAAP